MNIRNAKETDYKGISLLRKDIVLSSQTNPSQFNKLEDAGFVIGEYTREEFLHDLNKIFLVAEVKQRIAGYVILSDEKEFFDNDYKIWLDKKYKVEYFGKKSIELKVINTGLNQGKGVGTALLYEAMKFAKKQNKLFLFSIVTTAPVINLPSIKFHLKHGFSVSAIRRPGNLFGLENYQCILFRKILE